MDLWGSYLLYDEVELYVVIMDDYALHFRGLFESYTFEFFCETHQANKGCVCHTGASPFTLKSI
jgi:hypothetical protein